MKNTQKIKQEKKNRRRQRVRSKVIGSRERPRLSVFRSLSLTSAQIIDDSSGKTLVAVSDRQLSSKYASVSRLERATEVGKLLATKAQQAGIKSVVFDRGSYRYHGRLKALAEGARASGLEF